MLKLSKHASLEAAIRLLLGTCVLGFVACGSEDSTPGIDNPDLPANLAPTAHFSGDSGAVAGHALTLDASGSSDRDGRVIGYRWFFGDGAKGEGATVRHTYGAPGNYRITLTVIDDAGAEAHSSRSITVANSSSAGDGGNAQAGAESFARHCTGCHAVGDTFESQDFERLVDRIETTMPPGNAGVCAADCAVDIAAFIVSW